ncbi:MAG TPA: hypothetical protein VJ183_04790 [Chloroflexia bacterium]|nr:hypothetical protein [Chloroflexia bacterium]
MSGNVPGGRSKTLANTGLLMRYSPYLQLGLLALLAIVVYASTPFNYWVADDFNYVVPKGVDRVISFYDPTVPTRAFYRPLTWTTWAIDYWLWGKSSFGWHVSSVIFHAATTVMVALLVFRLFKSWGIALAAGALFAVHPTHPETVTFIGGRADLICGLFYFAAVLFFVLYLQRRAAGRGTTRFYLLALIMAVGAILSKEMGVTLPFVLLLTDLFFFSSPGRFLKVADWRIRIVPHLPFLVLVAGYVLMRYYLVAAGIVTNTYIGPSLLEPQRLLDSTASNIMLYVGIWGGPGIAAGLPNLVKVLIVLLAVAGAVLVARWLGRVGLYCLLLIAITQAPTFNLTALRWLYIPSFGICLLLALAVRKLVETRSSERAAAPRVGFAVLSILVLAWGFGVIYENLMWYKSGEEARSILAQITEKVPATTEPVTIYFAGAPYEYDGALLFNTGLAAGVSLTNERRRIALHEMEQPVPPDPIVIDALSDPPKLGPNPVFLGYKEGMVISYSSLSGLMQAHPLKR